jgi:hypothetical protein
MNGRRGLPGGLVAVLTERDMRILAFERSWFRLAGAKEREILEVFGVPVTRYYQLLNELIDRPEAAAFDPVLVTRLRRQRSRRQRIRSARPD